LVALEDEGRREHLRRKELEEQERVRSLREQREKVTELSAGKESLQTITLDWEIFPPGTIDEIVRFFSFSGGMKGERGRDEEILRDRVMTFKALKPEAYIRGMDGFNKHIGAKFSDSLVVFENWRYGNALYILYEK
jgi:hypothetical protein